MTSVSVVIPCFNKWHLTHQLLFDLYKNCSLIEEVIVVDNGSTEKEVQDGLAWWAAAKMLPIETVTLKENVGFLRAANIGLKTAVEDVVCLISNDVRVKGDIVDVLKKIPDSLLLGGRWLDWDTGWNTFNGRIFPYLEGWILATTNKTWKELDYFDELFTPNDMEDIDLSTKALSSGIYTAEFTAGLVEHIGAQTISYGTERENITIQNKKKFEEKWLQK